jgi:peptidoglycan hydrolase-like protein with peptidoglycan-binding domain
LSAAPTGYFGSLTEAAVKKYQAAHSITMTGTVGPVTRTSLGGLTLAPTPVATPITPVKAPVVTGKFTRALTIGATGTDVKNLQIFLNTHGYPVSTSGAGSRFSETTTFGPATQRALAKFQLANKISPPAGYFGVKTMAVVNSIK